jgi:1,4-dihydroxy-2-naphthoate octaprenyltransferase
MRGPFLVLAPVCVFLGMSTVIASQGSVDVFAMALAVIGAFLAHISVNMLNEYFDFKSGLDLETIRTPFSGGSGALPQNPQMVGAVLVGGVAASIGLFMIGGYFAWQQGVGIVPVGLAGLVIIATYTSWINRHPFLCLIAPGLGFGFLMVAGTQFVLQGYYAQQALIVASVPFFLVNNLLLLNQFPDVEADRRAGRNHFPIAYGLKRSSQAYGLFVLMTIAVIVVSVLLGYLPMLSLIALIPMPLALFSLSGAFKYGENIGSHPQYLAANVVVTLLTTLLLGISLVI